MLIAIMSMPVRWMQAALVLTAGLMPLAASAGPAYVDLSAYQTPLRNQGGQRTCTTFSAIAGLEAAYSHAGYGKLDLSEQFLNHIMKMMWLHPKWNEVVAKGEDGSEGQVGAFAGGGGPQTLTILANGTKVPVEQALPYHTNAFTAADHPYLQNPWYSPFWRQRRMNDFNLDPKFLPRAALTQDVYYTVKRYASVPPHDANAVEAVLAGGHEVVADLQVNVGYASNEGNIWRPCRAGDSTCPNEDHGVLIIGYDRRDPNPANHHFIVKNSWGPTGHPGGFTWVSYDYVRRYNDAAAYIVEVEPPRPWPELAFVGRWHLDFDGHTGVLDIFHVPGVTQWLFNQEKVRIVERRIGSFYTPDGKAFRVNGRMFADHIEFYIDWANPNARWDQLGGRKFVYSKPVRGFMTGYHVDPDGLSYQGFATQDASFADGELTPRPFTAQSFLASWKTTLLGADLPPGLPPAGVLSLEAIDDSTLSPQDRTAYDSLSGHLDAPGRRPIEARLLIDKKQPDRIFLYLRRDGAQGGFHALAGRHLGHARGIAVGQSATPGEGLSFILVRAPAAGGKVTSTAQ